MKKAVFSAVLAIAMVFGAGAQVWIGGALGFDSFSIKDADGNTQITTSTFSISPEIGYSLNDRFDIGLTFGFGTEGFKPRDADRVSASSFAIAPFAQYTAIEFGRFRLLCRATVGFESYKGYDLSLDGVGFNGDEKSKLTGLGVNVTPFLHYVISDRFNVFGAMNFLSLNFASVTAKDDGEKLGTINAFNFGVDANNVFNTGAIQVGFIYKF